MSECCELCGGHFGRLLSGLTNLLCTTQFYTVDTGQTQYYTQRDGIGFDGVGAFSGVRFFADITASWFGRRSIESLSKSGDSRGG